MNPRISVIIPTLNDSEYIEDALGSVFAQSFSDYEVIVVDGGSTDGTAQILSRYRGRLNDFRQTGKGVSRAKNEAIKKAEGRYITFLDADDLWYPDKLKIQYEFMEGHPEYGFCSSDVDFFDGTGIFITGAIKTEKNPHSGYVFDDLFSDNFISSATIFLRRECFEKAGLFDEEILFAEDTDMWLRVAKEFKLGYIPKSLAKYRVHSQARTQQFSKHYASLERIYRKLRGLYPEYFQKKPELLRSAYSNLYWRWGYRYFETGRHQPARRFFRKALKYNPGSVLTWKCLLSSLLPPAIIRTIKTKKKN